MTETRPDIMEVTEGAELRDWYWLKEELLAACRDHGLSPIGSKAALTDRLAHFLDTGEALKPEATRAKGAVNWARDALTDETIIDAGYSNGPNVRAYFTAKIGPRFRFNITFMDWMKANTGKTLADAAEAWLEQEAAKKAGARQAIPASNQWNRYQRDFFAENPERSLDDARACWAWKRAQRGHNRFEPGDLKALDNA
ncbi:MAG: DUF6434 domain-containing protein [Pseudomonadota bacterium]